jgi:hypothetical protein
VQPLGQAQINHAALSGSPTNESPSGGQTSKPPILGPTISVLTVSCTLQCQEGALQGQRVCKPFNEPFCTRHVSACCLRCQKCSPSKREMPPTAVDVATLGKELQFLDGVVCPGRADSRMRRQWVVDNAFALAQGDSRQQLASNPILRPACQVANCCGYQRCQHDVLVACAPLSRRPPSGQHSPFIRFHAGRNAHGARMSVCRADRQYRLVKAPVQAAVHQPTSSTSGNLVDLWRAPSC